jgi:outer membrane receptor protein involved in Fe transport
MIRKIEIVIIVAFSYLTAQNHSILVKGLVFDQSTRIPMQYANILIFNTEDSIQVSGTATDKNGQFVLTQNTPGKYYLEISFIGFFDLRSKEFRIDPGLKQIDLGIFELAVDPVLSKSIEVVAEKSLLVSSIDRKIYNVEKDVLSQSGSASDILQNIPSVSVDVDGGVSLRGTANVTIFIDGKPSLLMRKNSATVLQQMPANTIERIEVIINPSAKYKPDGVSGIINIVLKNGSQKGVNGTISTNAGNGKRYNASMLLNYNLGLINIFGSYGFRHTSNPRVFSDLRIIKDSVNQSHSTYDFSGNSSVKPNTHLANLGLDLLTSSQNNVTIESSYFYRDSYHNQNTHTAFKDDQQQIKTDFKENKINDEIEEEFEMNTSVGHSFDKEGHEVQVDFNYSGYNEKEDNYFDETYLTPSLLDKLRHFLIKKRGNLAELSVEYIYPINEDSELEAGYAGELLIDDIRYLGEDFNNSQSLWLSDFNKTNHFRFRQDIHAMYTTYSREIDDFSFLAGLRAEQTLITSNLVSSDTSISNKYFKFFPTLHLAYAMSDFEELQLNYSKRINRADGDEHNPFAEYTDPRNKEAGNPKIKPEQIHSVELGYHLKNEQFSFIPSLYYRYKFDAFTEINRFESDSTLLTTYTNLQTEQAAGLELVLSGNLLKNLSYNISANAFYYVIDASNLGFSDKKKTISLNSKIAVNFHLTRSNLIQLDTA